MTRQELDKVALSLFKENKNVLLEWATGCGKTKQAISAISLLNKDIHNDILIVVAEIAHKKNWLDEFKKWNEELLTNINYNINIICYDSLHHFQNEHFDVVILDESHHIGTDIRIGILKNINADRFILLSATIDKHLVYEIENIIGRIKISTITLQDAIDWGFIPAPKIKLIPLRLDNKIINQTIEEVRGVEDKRVTIKCTLKDKWKYLKDKKKYPNLRLLISCTELQKYNDIEMKLDYYQKLYFARKTDSLKNKWLQYGSQRKSYLGQLKDERAKDIIKTFGNCRYICFCTNIEQADKLGGNNSIHSKKKESLDILNRFNNGDINSLFVVGMLKEGQNLQNIQKGLIIQLDGQLRPFIQKSGRVLRAEKPEIYIIYFEKTQDEVYLNKAIEGLNPDYIEKYENNN